MASIKSGDSTDVLTVDPVSKAARVTWYNSAGVEDGSAIPIALTVNSVTVVDNDIIESFDATDYKFVSLQLTGTWVGTVSFQGSHDNGTFYDVSSHDVSQLTTPYVTSISTLGLIKIPIFFKYLRVRVTAFTSGSVTGVAFGYKEDNVTGQISSTGQVTIAASQTVGLDTGANTIGNVGLLAGALTIGNVRMLPTSDNTMKHLHVLSGVGANETSVNAVGTNLLTLHIISKAATPRYVKLYNQSTTPVIADDSANIFITIGMAGPGNSGFIVPAYIGIDFPAGLAYTIQLGAGLTDRTVFTVGEEVQMQMSYSDL